jgi:hypothetical protein
MVISWMPTFRAGDVSERLWNTPLCCVDANVGMKLKGVYNSAREMAVDTELWEHLEHIQHGIELSNMSLERLLATFRRNCQGKHPLIERAVSTGVISHFLGAHLAAGGAHPLAFRRDDLVARGVPLQAASNAMHDGRMSRGNTRWAAEKYKELVVWVCWRVLVCSWACVLVC